MSGATTKVAAAHNGLNWYWFICNGTSNFENCHCSKILSTEVQTHERCKLLDSKRLEDYKTRTKIFNSEDKDFRLSKLVALVNKTVVQNTMGGDQISTQNNSQSFIDYQSVRSHLTETLLQDDANAVLCNELKSFVCVWSNCVVKRGKIHYPDVPTNKQMLILKCIELKNELVCTRLIREPTASVNN